MPDLRFLDKDKSGYFDPSTYRTSVYKIQHSYDFNKSGFVYLFPESLLTQSEKENPSVYFKKDYYYYLN